MDPPRNLRSADLDGCRLRYPDAGNKELCSLGVAVTQANSNLWHVSPEKIGSEGVFQRSSFRPSARGYPKGFGFSSV